MLAAADSRRAGALRVHSDALGRVWVGDDSSVGCNTEMDVTTFFESASYRDLVRANRVRILGTRGNAAVIVKLWESRVRESSSCRIELGSPAVCQVRAVLDRPDDVLRHLWQPEPCSDRPGTWHRMSRNDFPSYAIAGSIDAAGRVTDLARNAAAYHPAWPALTFAHGSDPDAACRLIADVIDPRWFSDPYRPGRLSRLNAHLGLTPQNASAFFDGGPQGRHYNRATNAISVWYNSRKRPDPPTSGPAGFLWRIFRSFGDASRGLLRATERMVSLAYHVWINAVMPPHPEVGFRPFQFFKSNEEAVAFMGHHSATARGV